MNEYLFGTGPGFLPETADKIARAHGAVLVNHTDPQCTCGKGCAPSNCNQSRRHWFACDNAGNGPSIERAVLEELYANNIIKRKFRLGLVSIGKAQYLMMAPAVAGGWIMIPGEWANSTKIIDHLQDPAHPSSIRILALLPVSWDVSMTPISADRVIAWLEEDITRTQNRSWCRGSIESDLKVLREWLKKLQDAKPIIAE
jgi:hypothetical protein